jgi:hypothetical protein
MNDPRPLVEHRPDAVAGEHGANVVLVGLLQEEVMNCPPDVLVWSAWSTGSDSRFECGIRSLNEMLTSFILK